MTETAPALPRVLFVCVENSCRSQMAEAFARLHGAGLLEAHSAGSRPGGTVHPRAIASMAERGYDLSAHRSKSLDQVPRDGYAWAVTMGCGDECPDVRAERREDWGLADPKHMEPEDFALVRDEIERRVLDLCRRLEAPAGDALGQQASQIEREQP